MATKSQYRLSSYLKNKLLTNFSSVGHCIHQNQTLADLVSLETAWKMNTLTQYLLQLHNTGIRSDTVNGLGSGVHAIFKHLGVRAIVVVRSHDEVIELYGTSMRAFHEFSQELRTQSRWL